ncbi:MAG: hypothetical protein R3B84_14255 [Zavarzinella sp.]
MIIDCTTARMFITFFGSDSSELSEQDRTSLQAHVQQCAGCHQALINEQRFDLAVGKAMHAVAVPSHLAGSLSEAISHQHVGRWRTKAWWSGSIAAAIILTVGGWYAFQISTAPNLDAQRILAEADGNVYSPEKVIADHGIRFHPEMPFDLNMLRSVGESKFQGAQVPMLYFVNPNHNAWAKVFVVRNTDFNWKELQQNIDRDGSAGISEFGFQLRVVADRSKSDIAYIVVFTGDSLRLFLETRSVV